MFKLYLEVVALEVVPQVEVALALVFLVVVHLALKVVAAEVLALVVAFSVVEVLALVEAAVAGQALGVADWRNLELEVPDSLVDPEMVGVELVVLAMVVLDLVVLALVALDLVVLALGALDLVVLALGALDLVVLVLGALDLGVLVLEALGLEVLVLMVLALVVVVALADPAVEALDQVALGVVVQLEVVQPLVAAALEVFVVAPAYLVVGLLEAYVGLLVHHAYQSLVEVASDVVLEVLVDDYLSFEYQPFPLLPFVTGRFGHELT